jgi:hypothetical protein
MMKRKIPKETIVTSPVVTIELTADGVQEVSPTIRTASEKVEAAMLMQKIAPALERFDRAVHKQVHARHEGQDPQATPTKSPENLRTKRKTE